MCLTSRSWVSRLVPLLLGRIVRFNSEPRRRVCKAWNLHFFFIIVENRRFSPIKDGPTSIPSSSKLGTCQGQHSFTLAYQLRFEIGVFERLWPPLDKSYLHLQYFKVTWMRTQVEATHARNRRVSLKTILDQRGEIRCFATCNHITCAIESPFSIV